jgi:S1-C subfamily serine protease
VHGTKDAAGRAVAEVATLIIAGKPVDHSFMGVSLDPASTGGAQIATVRRNSPASRGGLKPGDTITALNGKPISSTQQLIEMAAGYRAEQTVPLTVKREGSTQTVDLTLATRRTGTGPSAPTGRPGEEESKDRYLRRERRYGSTSRSITSQRE